MNTPLPPLPRRLAVLALAATAAALLGACASAPKRSPTLITLPSAPGAPGAPGAAAAGHGAPPTLALARLELPEYLVSRRVRYRTDGSTLAEWPDTFWAERIEVGMAREFGAALRARLPGWRVCESNCAEWAPVATLRVSIERLDAVRPEQRLRASARIAVTRTAPRGLSEQAVAHELPLEADTPQAQARAYAALLARLAADAAAVLPRPAP
ncbi:MAG: membrane integrity-associated transporter subunit PqiC [Hydrogenophaga sp.]|uniref:PqiC family protein n=1 Tax=Hydrogenophaga sp. TaxID=1904254 RepID=UPI00257A041C|nr:ABC-type transport auxiliary lipoprotein family protein [Hydrogenophaga sp.]MBL0944722.1 membrane integrity-associated transporter subunit PqiC [Hydrogenophaga sp.]